MKALAAQEDRSKPYEIPARYQYHHFLVQRPASIHEKVKAAGAENCCISEVTVAELRFGVECSELAVLEQKRARLEDFLSRIQILPFTIAIDLFAKEKARLRLTGEIIADFDILIGASAVQQGLILVTNNSKHLSRINGVQLEDWTVWTVV